MSSVKLFNIATEVIESVIIESCLLYYRSNTTKSVIIETGLHYYSVKKILHYITLLQYIKNIQTSIQLRYKMWILKLFTLFGVFKMRTIVLQAQLCSFLYRLVAPSNKVRVFIQFPYNLKDFLLQLLQSSWPWMEINPALHNWPNGKVQNSQIRGPWCPAVTTTAIKVCSQAQNVAIKLLVKEVHEFGITMNISAILLPSYSYINAIFYEFKRNYSIFW